ncbi:MAG: glycosyltransferase family 39 protein [Acidobacteriia bacterium]|nr:glycosyltransferase family 39 protein [Terriglobia bacterium]
MIACSFFFFSGLAFLPHLGVQNDEAIFGMAFLKPLAGACTIRIGHSRFPLMLMSYLGTLKAWLYRPVFRAFGTGVWTLRLPVLFAGVASVWLFYLLLRRIAGERAALIGCSLLAVDATYLLTVCFDWGPVALQHLLLVAGLLALVKFYQERREVALAGGFFLLGLAMWDKALAVWMLSGIALAALALFPRRVLAVVTGRRVAIAVLAFALGALPLLVYNAQNDWPTLRGTFTREPRPISGKAMMLVATARGEGLFGWMFFENWQTPAPHEPYGGFEKASAWVGELAGHPRRHLLFYAFLLALLLAPLARGDALRAILFAVAAMAVAWYQMAITANAGGTVHHTILLWPFPQLAIAVSFAAASRQLGRFGIPVVAVVTAVMAVSGALVVNEHHLVMLRYGGSQNWTDAIFKLDRYVEGIPAQNLYCLDWGIADGLRVLGHGTLPVQVDTDPISKPELSEDDRAVVRRMIADPDGLFLAHTKDYEFFPGVNQKLVKFAAEAGYERRMLATISDSYGRPAYEVYRFAGR